MSDVLDSEIKMCGYKILRTDSHSTRTGGVIVYVKVRLKIMNIKYDATEFIWLKSFNLVTANSEKIKIVPVYMSANTNKNDILDYFENWCENNCENGSIIICGDLNIDMKINTSYRSTTYTIIG